MSIPLVVLAAGLSTRYGRLKQLDPLGPGGEAIMDFNVFDAVRAGFDRVIFVVRPEIHEQVSAHVADVVGDHLRVDYVFQTPDQVPEGFRSPPDRRKPWGTAHAVLCASAGVEGRFAVCNADDLYGPTAFRLLYEHLSSDPIPNLGALVGYTLADTLTGAGGVARGVCVLRREGLLERVTEVQNIHTADGWTTGVTTDGTPVELSGREVVSMNLWGFTQPIVELMHRQFNRFLGQWGADTTSEFFLSTAVNGQIQIEASDIYVLHTDDPWLGVTHAADRERAHAELAERVTAGTYPERLADGFRELG